MRTLCSFVLGGYLIVGWMPHGGLGAQHAQTTTSTSLEPPTALYAGTIVEREASKEGEHAYEVNLTAGDFLDIGVTQNFVRIGIRVTDPDGARTHDISLQTDPLDERLMFIAKLSGVHRIAVAVVGVTTVGTPAPDGLRYVLQVHTLRPATADDISKVRVFAVVEEADAMVRLQSLDGMQSAIRKFREAADGWRSSGDTVLEATTLDALASVAAFFSQFRLDAIAARIRLIEIWRARGRSDLERLSWSELGVEYADDAQWEAATEANRRVAELALDERLQGVRARALTNVALGNVRLGRFDLARRTTDDVIEILAAYPDAILEARVHQILGELSDVAGDLDAALDHHRQSLALGANNRVHRAGQLLSLGFLHLRRGDIDEAEAQFNARLAMSSQLVQREQEGLARLGLGDVRRARGNRAGARQTYQAAQALLAAGQTVQSLCVGESRLGRLDMEEGDLISARTHFDRATALSAQGARTSCEAEGRAGLADVAMRADDLVEAEVQTDRALALADTLREAVVGMEARALGSGAFAPVYEQAIDVAMRLAERGDRERHVARALEIHERSLARALVDALSTDRAQAAARVPFALEQERRTLRDAWRARVIELQSIKGGASERRENLTSTIGSLAVRLRQIEGRIDGADPRHSSFVRPRALDVTSIQALLDNDTALLEYALGDTRSVLWVVSPRSVQSFTLPPRAEIERLARRVHLDLAQNPVAASATAAARTARDIDALSRVILAPAAHLLPRRVLAVAPESLALIPFAALTLASPDGRRTESLATRHEVVHLPSATVLAALRSVRGRPRPGRQVAVFADPVYDRADPRLPRAGPTGASAAPRTGGVPALQPSTWARSRSGATAPALSRLPFSRDEANAIAAFAPGSSLKLVGFDATRARALSAELGDFRIVHFAAHGLVHPDVPNASGVALSLVNAQGGAQNGFLLLPDVYELKLNADLVVLSACQTALGNSVRGEGVIGLTRGFMFAGAAAVVSSLWRVDDEATAALMTAFYRGMLRERLSPGAALRTAQLEVARTPRWRAPYYWAGFVLHGDWR